MAAVGRSPWQEGLPIELHTRMQALLSQEDRCRSLAVCRSWRATGQAAAPLWASISLGGEFTDPAALAHLEGFRAACRRWPAGTLKELSVVLTVNPERLKDVSKPQAQYLELRLTLMLLAVLEQFSSSLERLSVDAEKAHLFEDEGAFGGGEPPSPTQRLQHALSRCSQLRSLEIRTEEGMPIAATVAGVCQLPQLTHLVLRCGISRLEAEEVPLLPPALQELELSCDEVPASLAQLTKVQHLSLTGFESKENEHITAICQLTQLTGMTLSSPMFAELPPAWTSLARLEDLKWSNIGSITVQGIGSIRVLPHLTSLSLKLDLYMDDDVAEGAALGDALQGLSRLRQLEMPRSSQGLKLAPGAWQQQLTHLDVRCQHLGASAVVEEAGVLGGCTALRQVCLSGSHDEGNGLLLARIIHALPPLHHVTLLQMHHTARDNPAWPSQAVVELLALQRQRPDIQLELPTDPNWDL